ncbi:hypothetical protein M9H77_09908 [Catharanthus roseus]|uniref:Uncharacterized protein n=1 Tax=Catharanthus roseus TaxID=4058 RepID=A0ACC0C2I1_CATRO|nr:hypothetical protein M9H77_09908 [Catharanthus roseus]
MNQTPLNFGRNPIRDSISRIRFAPNTNNLLISSWDSTLRLYNMDSSKLRVEASIKAAILDCCFENESAAFSAASDGSVLRHDLLSGNHGQIGSHDDLATCVEYSDEKSLLVTAGWDKKIKFWDARSTSSVGCLNNLIEEAESMSVSGFHLMIAVGTSVQTHDLRILRSVQTKESFMDVRIKCLSPIIDSAGFAVGSFDGRVALEYFSQSNSGNRGYAFRCHPRGKEGRQHLVTVNDIIFNPAISGIFVTGDNEGYATAWDARSKKRLFELPRCSNSIVSLSYNHNGSLLAVASSYSYQDANARDEMPQIFMHEMNDLPNGSFSAGR